MSNMHTLSGYHTFYLQLLVLFLQPFNYLLSIGDIPRQPLYPPLPPRPGSHSNTGKNIFSIENLELGTVQRRYVELFTLLFLYL